MNGSALYFTTGQAARELGVSSAQVCALCESGAIEAETTPGNQWRVAADELDRLKRDGLPLLPRPLPGETAARKPPPRHTASELLAEPSGAARSAAEAVAIARSVLEKRKVERDIEETEDWFRDREQKRSEQQAPATGKSAPPPPPSGPERSARSGYAGPNPLVVFAGCCNRRAPVLVLPGW